MKFENILCCTDFSDDAEVAFRAAVNLATLSGAKTITLLHVIPEPEAQFWKTYIYEVDEDLDAKAMRDIDEKIAESYKSLTPEDITLDVKVQIGPEVRTIIETAEELKPDLLVIGHRGHSKLHDMFAGNVSEKIARHAPCPILIVPTPKDN